MPDIHSFMGLIGYYQGFIKCFSKIAFPTTSLQRKGCIFKWTSECQASFEWLKELLTTAPVLQVADPNREFEVCADAFNEGVGAVLTQDGKIITYESRNLNDDEH